MTNQEESLSPAISHTIDHLLVYCTLESGKTSFWKHNFNQTNSEYLVFDRDRKTENKAVDLLQIEKFDIESLAFKTIKLDDVGAYKQLKTKVKESPEDCVCYESYFFTGDGYNKLKFFPEEMSDQTIEITPRDFAIFSKRFLFITSYTVY